MYSKHRKILNNGFSFKIDYKDSKSILCELGRIYDTDKSSQRNNVTNTRHCHPYTLFYNSLFEMKRKEPLNIAELGVLEGGSLLMWRDYFPNSMIYGFDFNVDFLNKFKNKYNNETRIILNQINVKDRNNIKNVFSNINKQFDIIIEDTTHQFDDQIRVIQNVYPYLKPGGLLIIEDIFKKYNEKKYYKYLNNILLQFQDSYFVSLEHQNRNSTGWDNDKLFILVKAGGEPIFQKDNKLTIITPSYRLNNLIKIRNNINFSYINEWIIVYDGKKISTNPKLFEKDIFSSKIREYVYNGEGISGNPQRNFALTKINDDNTFLYYLDDDNIIHNNLYKFLNIAEKNKMYTFDQENRINGNIIEECHIDTAMVLIDTRLCKYINWEIDKYTADGIYIKNCYNNNKRNYIYVNNSLSYYNKLV